MNNFPGYINEQSQMVGCSGLQGDTAFQAFLWEKGVMTDLGTLPGDVSSLAASINSFGQVVGFSLDADRNPRAFIWQDGRMTDLNTLTPADSPLYLLFASGGINDRGQIAGAALVKCTGEVHAFLATPANNATRGVGAGSVKVTIPENARSLLQKFMGRLGKMQLKAANLHFGARNLLSGHPGGFGFPAPEADDTACALLSGC